MHSIGELRMLSMLCACCVHAVRIVREPCACSVFLAACCVLLMRRAMCVVYIAHDARDAHAMMRVLCVWRSRVCSRQYVRVLRVLLAAHAMLRACCGIADRVRIACYSRSLVDMQHA